MVPDIRLASLRVTDFRSIRGSIFAPLDAQTILVHGENGVGKTSLLSAIELALRGGIEFLELADRRYDEQLLHRAPGIEQGQITLTTRGLERANVFDVEISKSGHSTSSKLDRRLGDFFKERCYLPQALLNQLLQIYQNSSEAAASPLASFVSALLGLERLDAIEAGLAPVDDIRNLRKVSRKLTDVEGELSKVEREIAEQRQRSEELSGIVNGAAGDLYDVLADAHLESEAEFPDKGLPRREALSNEADSAALTKIEHLHRRVDHLSIQNASATETDDEAEEQLVEAHRSASKKLERWRANFEPLVADLVGRIAEALPAVSLPTELSDIADLAVRELQSRANSVVDQATRQQVDTRRSDEITEQLAVARRNLATAESEIEKVSKDPDGLGALLAEIAAHIQGDICPVCDRDFAEIEHGALTEHVGRRVQALSTAAERMLSLGSVRSELQSFVARLEREAAEINTRALSSDAVVNLQKSSMTVVRLARDLQENRSAFDSGARLMREEAEVRRRLANLQSRNGERRATMSILDEIARDADIPEAEDQDTIAMTLARLLTSLSERSAKLQSRISARRRAIEMLDHIDRELAAKAKVDALIVALDNRRKSLKADLARATEIRSSAQSVKGAVETVRARIIRREFNDRLNALWRDLFVRLAPNEPFVPAFQIPESVTQNLQPKLITHHRSGIIGGTPGAMLSAGNLNTAALTLFVALHLTMKPELPWLILDDPVQSMDDVHIAHFAALLRTLAKEHGRQVIIAVHDRQLFEYLRLELSPAYEGDTLQTLELTRRKDLICPLLSGPKLRIFWMTKETWNAEQEASPGRDYRQAA
jgi:exonuclease SbcC